MEWNSDLYNAKHDFVAEYGNGLLEFIPHNPQQTILDLGCGTGALTAQLVPLASKVIGIDSSQSMIEKARAQYGNIEFLVCDALNLPFKNEWDVVFSNAVFHWIEDHDALLKEIRKVLKQHGMLVCEFGASGNIHAIESAFLNASEQAGYTYTPKFNFPTAQKFGSILKSNGFIIDKLYDYDRPTVLKDAGQGLANWLRQFFASELSAMSKGQQERVLKNVENSTRDKLWTGKEWVADYRRLRAIAHIGE